MAKDGDPLYIRVLFGGTSCAIATVVTNPVDLIKVRMQVAQGTGKSRGEATKIICLPICSQGASVSELDICNTCMLFYKGFFETTLMDSRLFFHISLRYLYARQFYRHY